MITTLISVAMAATPTPDPDFDPNTVTPGWLGFAAMFLVVVATVFLLIDMVRRVRRTRYRGEIKERLEAERQAAEQSDSDSNPPSAD